MANDAELQEDVIAELRSEVKLRGETIGVRVRLGVVTLTGFVASYSQKLRADHAVRRVAGVKALASEIGVKREGAITARRHAGDTETAQPAGT